MKKLKIIISLGLPTQWFFNSSKSKDQIILKKSTEKCNVGEMIRVLAGIKNSDIRIDGLNPLYEHLKNDY